MSGRRNHWVKEVRRLNSVEQVKSIRSQRVVRTINRPDVALKAKGALGEAGLTESVKPNP